MYLFTTAERTNNDYFKGPNGYYVNSGWGKQKISFAYAQLHQKIKVGDIQDDIFCYFFSLFFFGNFMLPPPPASNRVKHDWSLNLQNQYRQPKLW